MAALSDRYKLSYIPVVSFLLALLLYCYSALSPVCLSTWSGERFHLLLSTKKGRCGTNFKIKISTSYINKCCDFENKVKVTRI